LKTPPHDTEAEKAVLSGVFLDNEVMYIYEGLSLSPADFYYKEHEFVYKAICQLWSDRRTVDVITVADQLTKEGNLDIV
jgi:replicative DNA helicase